LLVNIETIFTLTVEITVGWDLISKMIYQFVAADGKVYYRLSFSFDASDRLSARNQKLFARFARPQTPCRVLKKI
jgi:hypothetical protein